MLEGEAELLAFFGMDVNCSQQNGALKINVQKLFAGYPKQGCNNAKNYNLVKGNLKIGPWNLTQHYEKIQRAVHFLASRFVNLIIKPNC